MASKGIACKGFTLIELLVVIVIIGILAAIALPNYIKVKEKAKEAEVKANLHNIQLSVERFAVDTEGAYPSYLIGGEAKFSRNVSTASSSNAFTNVEKVDPLEGVSDPLLRRGYIDAYPRNPFTRNGVAIHQIQEDLSSSIEGNDPLRNGTNGDGELLGTRFGPYCTSMGSVLADPRFREWTYVDTVSGSYTTEARDTWAIIEYDYWDMWQSNKPLPYMPGQFFYKGVGPIITSGADDASNTPIIPTQIDQYMLGGYGGMRTKGKDILGIERQIEFPVRVANSSFYGAPISEWRGEPHVGRTAALLLQGPPPPPPPPPIDPTQLTSVWPWTRSEVGNNTDLQGSPYSPANVGDTNEQLMYGNPNAIRDGIILVLTAGEDYIGDR